MKVMQILLYVFALLFIVSGVFAVLPWPWVNGYVEWAGGIAYPDDAIVVYTVRSFLLIAFWLGVLVFVAARDPAGQSQLALVLAGLFATTAVLCLVLGLRYGLPSFFYFDVISSAILAALLLGVRLCATGKATA